MLITFYIIFTSFKKVLSRFSLIKQYNESVSSSKEKNCVLWLIKSVSIEAPSHFFHFLNGAVTTYKIFDSEILLTDFSLL